MLQKESSEITDKGRRARKAAFELARLSPAAKNGFLLALGKALKAEKEFLLRENELDCKRSREAGISASLLDRLSLNEKRIDEIAQSLIELTDLKDPVGEVLEQWTRPNGMHVSKVRVPFGVIGIIYEARPNVTVDSAALCIKTGNACLLRGSSSALSTNKAILDIIRRTLKASGLPEDAVLLIEDTRRESIVELLRLNEFVDVVIPRGGADLIRYVVENATVPVIETGAGNCHVFVNGDADPKMALQICVNAKTQRPSVCNAAETFLVHDKWARQHLPELVSALREKKVECRGCERTRAIVPDIKPAVESDWATEFHDLIVAVRVVDSTDEAIQHINSYGTRHSETIVTEDKAEAAKFFSGVDAAALYHNVSTRFTDGFEFGFGAEIGISTQKLHARGPMGLKELTSYKYLVSGSGQIRG